MTRTAAATVTAYAFFFLTGFFINLGGTVSNAAAAAFGTDTAALGICFSLFMAGRLGGILGNGALVRLRINRDLHLRLIALVPLLATAAMILAARNLAGFAALIFLNGIGIGLVYSASNMILVDVYEGGKRAFHLSMINFLYSLGAVFAPTAAGYIVGLGLPWNAPYLLFALLLAAWFAVTARSSFAGLFEAPSGAGEGPAADSGGITLPLVLVCAAIAFSIFGEYMVTFWTPIYLREYRQADPLFAGMTVSAFWIAVLAGRFAESMLIARIKPRRYLVASSLAAAAALAVLPFQASPAGILGTAFAGGLFCAGVFPALFTFGASRAERLKRTFPTLMMLSAAAGSLLAMPAGSLVKRAVGIRTIMFAGPAAFLLVAVLALVTDSRGHEKSGSRQAGGVQ